MTTGSAVGLLPEEIVQFIVRETSLQAVWSFCMASRFWYKKLRHLLAHPKILVVQLSPDGLEHYRAVFKLNGGFGKEYFQPELNLKIYFQLALCT